MASISYWSSAFSSVVLPILGGELRLVWTTIVSMIIKYSWSRYILPLHTQSRFQVHLHYTCSSSVKSTIVCVAWLIAQIFPRNSEHKLAHWIANAYDQEMLWTGSNLSITSGKLTRSLERRRKRKALPFQSPIPFACLLPLLVTSLDIPWFKWIAFWRARNVTIFIIVGDGCIVIIMAQSIPSVPIT